MASVAISHTSDSEAEMVMGECRECGRNISSEAKVCPYCGAIKPVPGNAGTYFTAVVVLIGAVIVFLRDGV